MPDELRDRQPPPVAASGRVADDQVLWSAERNGYGRARVFAGTADPTQIWFEMVRNTRNAIEYYRELEEKDDAIGDAVDAMKRSVLKRNMTVVPLDESSSPGAEIAGFIQAQLDGLPDWRNSMDAMLDSRFYGFTVSEQDSARQQDMPLGVAVLGCRARTLACNQGEAVIENELGRRRYDAVNAGAPKPGHHFNLRLVWESSAEEEKDMRLAVQPVSGDRVLVCSHGDSVTTDGLLCFQLLGGVERAG